MKYTLAISIIILLISVFTIVYSYTSKTNVADIYNKVDEEINYIDKEIIQIMKMLNNLDNENLEKKNIKIESKKETNTNNSQKQEEKSLDENAKPTNIEVVTQNREAIMLRNRNDIDWKTLQNKIEKLSNTISIITIDLASININNEDILSLSSNIDSSIVYAKTNDKINLLISLAKIYSLLPEYKKQYSDDENIIELLYLKANILSSYAILDTLNWDNIYALLLDADNRILSIINSENTINNKNLSINKSYVLLKEYIKSANEQNLDLCYIKFFYLISELENA